MKERWGEDKTKEKENGRMGRSKRKRQKRRRERLGPRPQSRVELCLRSGIIIK